MNAVGIDVSKGKSTVTVLQPFGVVIAEPFEVLHTADELKKLVTFIKSLSGETKVVMEYTGAYYEPIANALYEAGIFVSVVNPIIINDYSTNRVRKVKTDRVDALRIAAFTLDRWLELRKYEPADTVRKTLKVMNRQCLNLNRILVMQKNNLISLLDSVFPGANNLFTSPCRETDGHEKWVDFVLKFPHVDTVAKLSLSAFKVKYHSWCKKEEYRYSDPKLKRSINMQEHWSARSLRRNQSKWLSQKQQKHYIRRSKHSENFILKWMLFQPGCLNMKLSWICMVLVKYSAHSLSLK